MGQSLTHAKHVGGFNLPISGRVSASVVREATLSEDLDAIKGRRFQCIEVTVGHADKAVYKLGLGPAKAWRDLLDQAIADAEAVDDLDIDEDDA